jgi:NNP family nitrate/nitrite transporter-like MFS transporter
LLVRKTQERKMPALSIGGLNFLSREPKIQVLHFTWVAFFLSFLVWFNHAPLLAAIRTTLNLNDQQVSALLILNVALTIPARIVVGMLVDKFGPRLMFSGLLVVAGLLCIWFALAQSFATLAISRFLLGFVGAGFVVGIRMIAEWFPAKETGIAQGIYAGFGNFGSAAAAVTLPTLSLALGGAIGWRWSIMLTGLIAIVYGIIYYLVVSDTPKGSTYFRPKKIGALEVTSRGDFFLYAIMQVPLFLALGVLAWKLGPSGLRLLSASVTYIIYAALAAIYAQQIYDTWRINKGIFNAPVAEIHRYKFRQVAVLDLAYFITFGSELAVVSILPLLFKDTFDLSLTTAGLLGASFGFTTFFARPIGGWLSDRFERRNVLLWCLAGTAAGYLAMSFISPRLGLVFAVLVTFACSLFVNAGNGTVYAMLPMIKRRLTGQIAGMVGAYGNVGGVLFLTVFSLVSTQWFFMTLAASALVGLAVALIFVEEPKGQIAEFMPDGTVTMIDVT